jgi:Domain of unknown function (DUF6046)
MPENYKDIKNYLGNPQVQPVGLFKKNSPNNVFWFTTEPTIRIAMEKIIVRKSVLKKGVVDGTQKELFSTGDFQISIEGHLSAQDDKGIAVYPSTEAVDLFDLMQEDDSLGIVCDLTNLANVGMIAVARFTGEREGDIFPFTIMGYSDRDILMT